MPLFFCFICINYLNFSINPEVCTMIIPMLLIRNLSFIKVSPGPVTMPGPQEAFKSIFFVQMNEYMNFRDAQFYSKGDDIVGPTEGSL